jgi:hypothetical protein
LKLVQAINYRAIRCRRLNIAPLAALVAIALASAPTAQAGMIFDYVSTVNVATVPTLPTNPPGFGAAAIGIGAGNSLTFTTNSGIGLDGTLPGGADINFGTVVFNNSASNTVVGYDVNFNYEVTLTDQPSGDVGTVNFTGELKGFARGTPRAINSTTLNYAVTPQILSLGGSTYLVSLGTITGPGSLFDGVLQGRIAIVPEPSSIVLAGIAGTLGVLLVRRKRMKSVAKRRTVAPD